MFFISFWIRKIHKFSLKLNDRLKLEEVLTKLGILNEEEK